MYQYEVMRFAAVRVSAVVALLACTALTTVPARGQSSNTAPGFSALSQNARVVIMPTDIELFEVSAGGVLEPKADWTAAANKYFRAALIEKKKSLSATTVDLSEKDADDLAEVNALHAAVARSVAQHHFGPGFLKLPTKEDKLDWSMGEAVRVVKDRSGADYALFTWIRDTYASGERIATMIVLALFGIGIAPGGAQVGYASLVDLNTGQIVWFNRLLRGTGDLREGDKAKETLDALLRDFPGVK